jgi:membrane glycosyltransferase
MSPVVLGLTLAVPIVALTSRPSTARGLWRTPEEANPPAIVERARALEAAYLAAISEGEAVARLARDARLLRLHIAMLPPPRRPRVDPIDPVRLVALAKVEEAESLNEALAALTPAEKAAALGDGRGVECLMRLAAAAATLHEATQHELQGRKSAAMVSRT